MATIDEILKKYQKALTKKQIEDLIQKSEQYKLLNAGNRANAQTQLAKQYRQTRRGLQNMGLAGREGKLLSGREIGVKDAYRNAYGTYNQQLQQSESAMLEKDAARKAAATIRARQRQVELQQKGIDYEKERFNQEQITDPRLSMEKPTLNQTKKTVVNTDNVDPRFASQIEAPVKSQVADYRHFVNQVEDLEKAREQYRQAKEYVDNYTPKSQRDYIGRRKYAEAKNLVNQYDAYVNGDKRARFAVEYNVDLDRVSVDDPETARKLGSNVEYWYNLIDQNSQQWDYAIKNHTHDEASALERKANAYGNLSRIAAAAKAPAEQRKYYLMSDEEFDTAYDAAERAYKRAEQEYQIAKKDNSGNMDDLISEPKAALEKAMRMKTLMDQIKASRVSNSQISMLASEMQIPESAKTKDKEYASTKEYVDENQAAGKITLKTKDWTLNINPWTNSPSQNWASVRDIGWSADDYAKAHDIKGSKYAALINEWSLINGRTAALFGPGQLDNLDSDAVGGTLDFIQALFGANRADTDVNYKWFRDECLMTLRGNYDDTGSDTQKEQMDAMLTLANLMTDEERARFNALLDTMGAKAADDYFDLLYKNVLPGRFTAYVSDYNADYMDELPWAVKAAFSVESVIPSLTQGIPSIAHAYGTQQKDPNAAMVSAMGYNQAQNIRNARMHNFGKVGQFAYGTAMSMWDSYWTAQISGGIGKALQGVGVGAELSGKIASTLGGSLLGASAYNSTYQEGLERGLTPEKARMTALGSGINEMLFEAISLDMVVGHYQKGGMLKVSEKAWKNWIVNTLVSAGVEGSEEVFTDVANRLWDNGVNRLMSEEMSKIREYVSQGMTLEEAKRKVNREFAEQLAMSFAGGAVSGGVMGGGSTFLGMVQNRGFERYGAKMDADAKAEVRNFNFKDEQMQELAKQSKLTNQDYGVLAAAMLQQRFEEGRSYVQNALKDGTITKEQKELYDKYAKMAKDGKLTADVVASDEYAQDMEKLEPVFDIMDEGELIQQGMRDLAEAQRAVRDENAKYDKQVAAIENDTTLSAEEKQQKLDAIENERGEKVVGKVKELESVQKKYDENVKAENGKVETKRGNLTYDFSTAKTFDEMSDRQKSAIRFAKLFADKYGMNIKVVDDSVAGERIDGEYNSKTNTITVNISGSNSVMYTVSHEITHWLQQNQSKAYNTLKGAIEKELSKTDLLVSELPKVYQDIMGDYKTEDNTVMDALVKYEQDMYKRQTGETLSKELAEGEVVARCCESFLKDRGFAQKMVAENPGTARTIAAKLRQLANDMKTLNEDALERGYEKYGELIDSSIEKAALEQIGDIEKIARMWENALNQAAKKAAKTKAPKAEVQHSFNNKLSDVDSPVVNKIADATFPIQPPTIKGADAMQKSVSSATKNALLDVQDSMFHPSQYSRNYAPQIQQRNKEFVMSLVNDDGTVKTDKNGNPLLRYPAWAYTRTGEKIVELAKRITKLYENQTDSHGNRLLPEETILSNNIFENASYLLDAEPTTECFRQTIYRAFLKQVTDKLGRPVTEREAIIVNQACIEIGIDAPCIYCYSLLDRKAKEAYKLQYIAERDAFFKALDKEYGDDIERFRKDRAEGEQTTEVDKKTQEEHKVWTKPYMLYLSRITDPAAYKDGKYQKSMARDGNWSKADRVNLWLDVWENSYKNGSLVTAKDVRNIEADEESLKAAEGNELRTRELQDVIGWSQDASQAKVIVPYSAYTNEGSGNILSWSQDKIDKLNSEYGLRWYSHADFHPAFIVDNMQQILDASAKGLKGLMYLKPTEAAEIYAPTGMLINLSCFAQYKNGQYVVDDRLGADWATVQRLRKQYKNVGAVMVVTSDDMWMWAMTQDWVDVIIPLHLVRSGRDFVDAFGLQNYSKEQADALVGADAKKKYEAYIEAKAKEQDIELNSKNRKELEKANKSVYPSEHENDYSKYMKACKKRGLTPRFDRMRQIVEKGASWGGKKITLDDYMKCVNETRMPYTKAQPLQPKFNFAAAERAAAQLKQKGFFDYFKPSSEWNGKTMKVGDWVNQAYNDILAKKEPSKLGYGRDLAIDKNGKYIEVKSSEEARQRGVGGAHDNVQHSFNNKEYTPETTMSMSQAKRMIEMAFNANGIRQTYGYMSADEWLNKDGVDNVAIYIDNTESTVRYGERYRRKTNWEVTTEDILNAYVKGTLVGSEQSAKRERVDLSKGVGYGVGYYYDSRIYAPHKTHVTQETVDTANQRVTKANKDAVYAARRDILFAAHSEEGLAAIGMTQQELNKKLRSWSNYSKEARDLSMRLNQGVAADYQWTGIQNSSILRTMDVTDNDIASLVRDIKGQSTPWQRNYIGNAMLALDTHIDWTDITFNFENERYFEHDGGKKAVGLYNYQTNGISISTQGYLNTVAHEMGHALDHMWAKDIIGVSISISGLSEIGFNPDHISDGDKRAFYKNFNAFIDGLTDVNDTSSLYTQERAEIFARFVARFVEWTTVTAGSRMNYENTWYNDKFTTKQYYEFVKLLQEKAKIDANRDYWNTPQYSLNDKDYVAGRLGNQEYLKYLQLGAKVVNQTATEDEIREFKRRMNELSDDNREAFLDKLREKLIRADEAAKVRLAERMAEGKLRSEERHAAEDREAKLRNRIDALKEELKQARERRAADREARNRDDIKKQIQKGSAKITQMLAHPTESKHVPVQLAQEVIEFMTMLNDFMNATVKEDASEPMTKRGKAIAEKLKQVYDESFVDEETIKKAQAENPDYNPLGNKINEAFKDLMLSDMIKVVGDVISEKRVDNLTSEELTLINQVLRGVTRTVLDANKLVQSQIKEDAQEAGLQMMSELRANKKMNRAIRFYLEESLDLRRIARIFSRSNDDAVFVKLANELNEGAIEKERIAQVLQRIFDPVTEKYGDEIRKWYGKDAEWIDTGIVYKGREVRITKGMRVSLALHVLNEGNMKHIKNGGITIPDEQLYKKGHLKEAYADEQGSHLVRLDEEDINKIISDMTDAEKAYLEVAKDFFHNRTGYYINRTSLATVGYRKAMVKNYFPIHTDGMFNIKDLAQYFMQNGSVEGFGFLKDRVSGSNPILLEDITSVINRQIKGVSLYAGLAPAVRNWNAVLNAQEWEQVTEYDKEKEENKKVWRPFSSVEKTMTTVMGEEGVKVVKGFLADVQELNHVDVSPMERFAGKLATNYVKAVLLGNLKVAMKQVASYPTAAAVIPWKYLGKALLKGGRNGRVISRADVDLINQYTPLYQMRREGQANEIASIMAKRGMEQKLPWLLGWITKMDVMTVGRLWSAAEYMVADQQNLPVGSDEYYKAVAKVFNDTIQQTQPNFTPLQRNAALRSKNPIVRSLVLFGTQRMQNGGILIEAAMDLKHSKGKSKAEINAAKMKLGRAVASQIVQNILLIVASIGVDALRGRMKGWQDDDKEITAASLAKGMGDMFLSNFIGSFLGGSETYSLFSGLFKKAMGETAYDTEFTVPALDAVETLINFAQSDVPSAVKYLLGDHTDEEKQKKAINFSYQLAKAFGYATGIPLENALKDVFKGIIPAIKDLQDWKKTGELNLWLHQSGKLDKKTTNANYKEWTSNGFKGSEYFYWENILTAYGKRDEKIPILLEADLPNEKKAMLLRMMDKSGATSEGTVVYKSNGDVLIDFANPTEKQQALPMPTAEPEETATPTTTPTATPKPTENPLTDARQEGVREAVAKGVPEQTAFDAFLAYQNMGKNKSDDYSRNDDFRAWLFANVDSPEQRAILEYQVIGTAKKVKGSVTYRDSGVVFRDYTNESWFKLSEHNLSKDGTNKRYEAGKRLEKTGLSVDKTVAIYDALAEYTKKAEWTNYLKEQGLSNEQITIFLWSRGWAKLG